MKLSDLTGEAQARDPEIVGLTADSREVKPGFLFAALEGSAADGAAFIPAAEKAGAAAVLARPGVTTQIPLIVDPEPRRRLAKMAARFYPRQPDVIAGITGTNGKTSTAIFTAQLWRRLGRNAGSLGTLGVAAPGFTRKLSHTTPDPVALHETLHQLAAAGATHLAIEVSSHGLAQHRVDGVRFKAAAFTNISQDHLDYHANFDGYFDAKLRLFTELLSGDGVAVVNADGKGAARVIEAAKARQLTVLTVGAAGRDIRLVGAAAHPGGLEMEIDAGGASQVLNLPLIGAFQAENALLAAAIVIGAGAPAGEVLPLLETLSSVPGRMERVAEAGGGAVYVDYAHTPDAIATALSALSPHVDGKLVAIIGAGGDRDRSKRELMGEAAAKGADIVIVTDDNPRSEDPGIIREQVLKGCPEATEIGNRKEAIATGIAMLAPGDALLIAGKGHETGQIVGGVTLPFDDAEVARAVAAERKEETGR